MYTKLYSSIFNGTLYGKFEPLTVFMAVLALADQHGEVDSSPERIAGSLGCSVEFVRKGLDQLLAPDPHSRTPSENGRRLIPLKDDEGNPRAFGWKIVNYVKYRTIRSEDERRAYKREWDRENRGASASDKSDTNPTNPTESDRIRPETTYTEAEAYTKEDKKRTTRGTRLPDGWTPSDDLWAWSLTRADLPRLKEELEKFRDWWLAQPGQKGVKLNWDATWRTWIRKTHEENKRRSNAGPISAVERVKRDSAEWYRRRHGGADPMGEDGQPVRPQVEQPVRIAAGRPVDPSDVDVGF